MPAGELATATWVTKPIAFPALLATLRRHMQSASPPSQI
jgi:hypothetical protein